MDPVAISPWLWTAFILCVLILLALDLGIFHRRIRTVKFKEALAWTMLWFALAMLFAWGMMVWRGSDEAMQFAAGYVIELSLSLDNVLVIALILAWFRVPREFQHRLLFFGILGALLMRGLLIGAGVALIHEFEWVLYLFGAFLVFAGVRMAFSRTEMVQPEKNLAVRLVRKILPVTREFDGPKFLTRWDGRRALTPLALVLVLVETSDLLFAFDSVPAVFSVTRNAFIVFTSNIFTILGLRSLYFLLAGAMDYFRYLKVGLSVVLVFIGIKMLIEPHGASIQWFQIRISTSVSLLAVAAILFVSIAGSVLAARRRKSGNIRK